MDVTFNSGNTQISFKKYEDRYSLILFDEKNKLQESFNVDENTANGIEYALKHNEELKKYKFGDTWTKLMLISGCRIKGVIIYRLDNCTQCGVLFGQTIGSSRCIEIDVSIYDAVIFHILNNASITIKNTRKNNTNTASFIVGTKNKTNNSSFDSAQKNEDSNTHIMDTNEDHETKKCNGKCDNTTINVDERKKLLDKYIFNEEYERAQQIHNAVGKEKPIIEEELWGKLKKMENKI